tara:strand:- start:272 stop:601 length:330 start_codon:yes stop_codon:yes gene_type:complete
MAPFFMSTLLSLLFTLPAFGCLLPSEHPTGYQRSTKDMMFLACMHGEDYIITTGSFDGLDDHMNNMAENIFPRRQSENFNRQLYYNGLSCARAIAKVDGIEIPSQYMLK